MMEEISQNYVRRWYDQISNMTMAVYVSQKLPVEIQGIIAKNLNEYIDTYRQMKRNDKHAVSLGSSRAMGLYKASNRLRWYDPDQMLHRAYTHMGTIPDFFLSEYAARIIDVSTYLKHQPQALNYHSHSDDIVDAVESILKQNFVSLEEDGGGIKLVSNTIEIPGVGEPHSRHIVSLPPRKNPRPTKR